MLDVSPNFLLAMRESHRVSIRVTIHTLLDGASVVADAITGSVRMDRDSAVRRQGSVTVAFDLESNLEFVRTLPFGGYCTLERGVLYADGTVERVQLGLFRIENVSWSELEGQATLELADRMAQVRDEVFTVPWVPVGLQPTDAIIAAVYQVFGDSIVYRVNTDPDSEPPILVDTAYDQDRSQAVADLASSIGATAYFDAFGDFVLQPHADADVEPPVAWEFEVGESGTLEEVQENLDRSAVRNGVAVRGQPAADLPPIYALAVDDDPSSPTVWGGPFGKVALIVSLQSVTTQKQANSTARSLLNLRLGLARTVTLRGVPMPALEPDDFLLARYLDGREEKLKVNSVAIPLAVDGAMELTVTGSYRPGSTLELEQRRRSVRVFSGPRAWRELDDAQVTAA